MATFVETFDKYKSELDNLGISYDEALLSAVTKGLGPAIYNEDSSRVSTSDSEELARVKTNFLIGKLGLKDGPELDQAIADVTEQLGASNCNKYRAIFYYLLVVKAMFIDSSEQPIPPLQSDGYNRASLFICTAGILLVGIFSFFMDQIGMYSFGM